MTKIIGIAGTKQSGKTTTSNFLHGHEMRLHDVIDKFEIKPDGSLEVNTVVFDEQGREHHDVGILDLSQNTEEFYEFASRRIWPLIRSYSFADTLKEICAMLFDIPHECLYGTDEQKNQIQEHLLWENMPGTHFNSNFPAPGYQPKKGPMTAREFMQFFGTDVMRKIYGRIWYQNCFKRIESDTPAIAVIPDCRFIDELEYVRENGGILIRLLRSPFKSDHISEQEVDQWDNYDLVVDNRDLSINESNQIILNYLISRGVTKPIRFDNGRYTTVK